MGLFSSIGKVVGKVVGSVTGGDLLGLGGDLISGSMASAGQQQTNVANAQEARANREWQQWMSSTAHEREVGDLQRAGLNPILSANGGASTPSGSVAQMGNVLDAGIGTAMRSRELRASLKQMDAATDKIKTDEWASVAAGEKSRSETAVNDMLVKKIKQETTNSAKQGRLLDLSIPAARNEASFQETIGTMGPASRFVFQGLKDILGNASTAKSLITKSK